MALKSTVLSAVNQAKKAVQDLAVTATLVSRGESTYVPGTTPTYPETQFSVSVVITDFEVSEIDGDRIRASDLKGLVFPESSVKVPEANDELRIGLQTYRIINNEKVMAGDTVALSQLQLRLV